MFRKAMPAAIIKIKTAADMSLITMETLFVAVAVWGTFF